MTRTGQQEAPGDGTLVPLVLGIETSCDETGAGLVRGHELLADSVASSVAEHARFGGVVPEVASRAHLEAMVPAVGRALATRPVHRQRGDGGGPGGRNSWPATPSRPRWTLAPIRRCP